MSTRKPRLSVPCGYERGFDDDMSAMDRAELVYALLAEAHYILDYLSENGEGNYTVKRINHVTEGEL